MRYAGMPTTRPSNSPPIFPPRPEAYLTPQQRLARGLPGIPAPRGEILPLGELARRERAAEWRWRIAGGVAIAASIVVSGYIWATLFGHLVK